MNQRKWVEWFIIIRQVERLNGGVRDRLQAFVDANKPPEGAVPPSVGEAPPADVGLETAEETVVDFPEPHQVEEPLVEEETTEG